MTFLATFAKYFSKRWFIWVMGILIATLVGMIMNAGNQKKGGEIAANAGNDKTRSAKYEEVQSEPNGRGKAA